MENNAMESQQRRELVVDKKTWFQEIFGQFLTAAFWKDVLKQIVHESVTAFFMAFGGTLYYYGKKRSNPEIANARSGIGVPPANPTTERAFGGYQPAPTYQPSSSYPVATSQGDQRFPGFGK